MNLFIIKEEIKCEWFVGDIWPPENWLVAADIFPVYSE